MAERDSRRTDLAAVRRGAVLAVPVALAVRAFIYVLALVFNPVLRDFAGGVRIPGGLGPIAVAAGFGAICGWFRMRDSRRYVSPAGDADTGAGRALSITRANLAADLGNGHSDVHGRIQRWSPDLLRGGSVHEDEALT